VGSTTTYTNPLEQGSDTEGLMSMSRRPLLLAALLLLSSLTVASVSAQSPLPGVEIICVNDDEEHTLFLNPVSSGAQATATCTVENTSPYTEEVEFDYDGDGLTMVGPETMSLNSGDEETIQIQLSSNSLASTIYNMTVTVEITSVQGIEPPDFFAMFLPSDESNIVAQVADFVDLSASLQPNTLILSSDLMQAMSVSLLISNDGNVDDNLDVSIQDLPMLDQRNIGWNLTNSGQGNTIESAGGSATYTLRFTPNPSMDDESFSITIRVKSEFSNSDSVYITLTINTTAPEESILDLTAMNIPAWAYIAAGTLAVLFVFAIVLSISKRVKSASQAHLDAMDGDDDDDFELVNLQSAIAGTLEDDDDLDDFELEDF
jgi:hypothetical protein